MFHSLTVKMSNGLMLAMWSDWVAHNVLRLQEVAMNQDQAFTNIEKYFN
jgi:hypothetical protein